MASFAPLPEEDRWALAFHAGRFAYPEALAEEGAADLDADPALRARIPNLQALVRTHPGRAGARRSAKSGERGDRLPALRSRGPGPARRQRNRWPSRTNCSARASPPIGRGDARQAGELALAAYLDGFEPVEAVLGARDGAWSPRSKRAMGGLRAAIARGAPAAEVSRARPSGSRPCSAGPRPRSRRRPAAALPPSSARSPSCCARGSRPC